MIRVATKEDLGTAMDWASRFHEHWAMKESIPFDPESMVNTLMDMIEGENGVVFLSDNGFIGGLMYPMYLNTGFQVAQEIFWFCDGKDEGLRKEFEDWARSRNAMAVIMCFIADDKGPAMERLYRMNGYRMMESQVVKELH